VLQNADGIQPVAVTGPVTGAADGPSALILSTSTPQPGQPPIAADGTISGGRWSGGVDLAAAAPGDYQVALLIADRLGVCSCTLTVANVGPTTVTGLDRPELADGAVVPVVVTGGTFAHGAAVTIRPPDGITIGTAVWNSRSQLTVPFTVSAQAVTGPRDVLVTNRGDAGPALCRQCLTVLPAPRLDTVTPQELSRGATTPVTVTGAELDADSVFDLGPGTTATLDDLQQTGDTQTAHVTVTVDNAAATGPHPVRVTTSAAGTATAPAPVTVKTPPGCSVTRPRS
jgi:hypothetical protein